MATALPVVESIAQVLLGRLKTISVANGYHQDIARVMRPTRLGGYSPADRLLVLLHGDRTRDVDNMAEFESITWLQQFHVMGFRAPSDNDPTPIDTLINLLQCDIETALCVDVRSLTDSPPPENQAWWLLADQGAGQLATSMWLDNPQQIQNDDGSIAGVLVSVVVQYTVSKTDPTVVM